MKTLRRIFASGLVVLLLAVQMLPAVPVSAYTEPDEAPIDTQIQRILGFAFMYCANGGYKPGTWGGVIGVPDESKFYKTVDPNVKDTGKFWSTNDAAHVGHEIEPDDGKVGCGNQEERLLMVSNTVKLLGLGSVTEFVQKYYTQKDDGKWEIKYDPDDPDRYLLFKDIGVKLAETSFKDGDNDLSPTLPGPTERKRRALVAVARCMAPIGNGTGAPLKIDGNEYEFKNGKEYRWRDGKDGGTQIALGLDWQFDGYMRCDTLVKIVNTEDFLTDDIDLNALWENPQLLAEQAGANGEGVIGGAFGAVSGGDNAPTCESETNNDMAWLLCAGIALIDDTFASMQEYVDELLDVSENEFDSPELKAVWSYFKNVATFMLILIGLVMIIGQAVSRD
jgi:hypothetical protein